MKSIQRQQVSDMLLNNPKYENRKYRYNVISEILFRSYGMFIEPNDCKLICSLADEYRHQTEKDKVGEKLEKDWHKTPEQHNFENTTGQLFKSIILN